MSNERTEADRFHKAFLLILALAISALFLATIRTFLLSLLLAAIRASMRKITVFLFTVLTMVTVLGSLMYLIEGPEAGFTSIPKAVYWAVVTLTTVGYGNITPQTAVGQTLAAFIMVMGYGLIAVPTGIVTVELSQKTEVSTQACPECSREGHDADASHCKYCGETL